MSTTVEPQTLICEAYGLLDRNVPASLTFEENGTVFGVDPISLEKMMAMDLGDLPVDSIAIPEHSPMFAGKHREITVECDISGKLTRYFPVHFVAVLYELQSLLNRTQVEAYVIGGITRDLLLYQEKRLELQDVDVTLEGDAIQLAEFLAANSKNFRVAESYPDFGTAKVYYKGSLVFDLATTRKEVYPYCGALPEVVERGVPLADDIIRRDFTINALAFSINDLGKILDYSNGIHDIDHQRIRVLHPVSFFEDPSRILRAFKFGSRFGFEWAEETRRLMEKFLAYGPARYKGGGERVKQELKGFLSESETDHKRLWLAHFVYSGCFKLCNMVEPACLSLDKDCLLVVSEKLAYMKVEFAAFDLPDLQFDVYLCFMLADFSEACLESTAHRLGLTRNERDTVQKFRKLKTDGRFAGLKEYSPAGDIYDLFHSMPTATVVAGLIDLSFENPEQFNLVLEAFKTYKRKWEGIRIELDGNTLKEMGVPEGKPIGDMQKKLLRAKLSGRLPDRMSEVRFVREELKAREEHAVSE